MKPVIHKWSIGDETGDLKCIGKVFNNGHFWFVMRCKKCGRLKNMLGSTLSYGHGITHKSCGKGIKLKNRIFYSRWQDMRARTTNPNNEHYDVYGGRGISSESYKYFIDFYDDWYETFCKKAKEIGANNVSIDRIDYNGDYVKENIRWIDKHEQPKNTSKCIKFEVTYPNGHKEVCSSSRDWSIKHGFYDSFVEEFLRYKRSELYGYKFRRLTENEYFESIGVTTKSDECNSVGKR